MAADDFQNTPPDQGFPAGLDNSSAFSGNRPASGARRATPGEVLSQGFQGAQNAGDFLGLDTEFTASQDPNQGYAGSPLDLVPPPGTYAPDASGYAPVPEPAPLPASDPVQDFAQAPSAFEFGEDLGSDESALAEDEEGTPRKKTPLALVGVLVAGLIAGGVFYGPTLYQQFVPTTEVAEHPPGWQEKPTRPKPETPAEPAPESAPTAKTPNAKTPEPLVASKPTVPASEPHSTAPKSGEPHAPLGQDPVAPKGDESIQSALAGPLASPSPAVPVAGATTTPRKASFPDFAVKGYDWASEDQLELIWRGTEVPLEAVNSPAKTLMPRVGNVRVFTNSGDVFDGRLYAVGQGLVWLDGGPGRIGLDGSKVERIEVLPPEPQGTKPSEELAGGRHVRVKVPGGMLYGSVLKAEGEDVTLALETGGRVRVKASDIQDLGSGRAIVVGR
jgi:hypothetical protein